jgi:hypothetical protein
MANHLTVNPSVLEYVARLPQTSHAIFCYENVETARQVLISYMNGGQENNEAVHILSSSRESFDDFLQHIELYPPFAGQQIDCIEMNKFSSKSKGINYETGLALARSRLDTTKKSGFKGLRLFVLANDYLDYTPPEGVLKFEERLGQNFPSLITAICAYDLAEAGGIWDQVLPDLLKVHGACIFKGLAGSDEDEMH